MENSNTVKRIVRRKKTLSRMAAGCISLILVVLGATYYRGLSSRTVEDTSVIISAKAKLGDVKTSITSSGTIEGVEAFSIRLPEGIKIKKILVSEGDAVKKGTKIASIAKASAADVLLTVRESVDTLEDSIEALDDDALTDKDSDDYLKKISYEGQLSDLKELKSSLEEILDSGYITASDAGIVSTLYISAEEEVGSTTQTGNTSSDNSDAAATSAVKTSYSAAVQTKPLFFSNVTSSEAVIMATSKASDTKISSTS